MLCLWPIHHSPSHLFFFLPTNHFNITRKIFQLQVFSLVKPVIPLHDRHYSFCFAHRECSPDSWCEVLCPLIAVVFSVTTQLSVPAALTRCWQQHWQGRDWPAWLEGLLEVTQGVERGETTLSSQTGSTQRQLLTPGPQRRDVLVASGAWSDYFTSLSSQGWTLCFGHPWVWVTCWQVFPGLNFSTLLHK